MVSGEGFTPPAPTLFQRQTYGQVFKDDGNSFSSTGYLLRVYMYNVPYIWNDFSCLNFFTIILRAMIVLFMFL